MSDSQDDAPDSRDTQEVEVDIEVEVSGMPSKRRSPTQRRPRSSMEAATDSSHSAHIDLASLQMAKARQEKIREALLEQVRSCEEEIQHLEEQIQEQLEALDLERRDEPSSSRGETAGETEGADDSFTHEY